MDLIEYADNEDPDQTEEYIAKRTNPWSGYANPHAGLDIRCSHMV